MELQRKKNFRKRRAEEGAEGEGDPHVISDDEQERRYRVSFQFIIWILLLDYFFQ
jgi:hypothetical protein